MAAQEGPVEQACQTFSGAPEGTTNVRVLYLAYEFYRRTEELKEWACGFTLSCYAAMRSPLQRNLA